MQKRSAYSLVLGVAALAATMSLTGCGGDDKAAQQAAMQQQAPVVATMKLEFTNAENQQEFPARLEGKTDIAIRPQVSGFITKVCVDEGQEVKKGQLLFTIDQVQLEAAVTTAQAAVNSAQTSVNTAKMTADTKRQLFEKNIISAYDYQLAQNQLQNAQAALAQAQAQLTSARKNLSYANVVAPSSGVVGTIPYREGSLASPSSMEPLTTISDNSQVYAYFSLTEKDLLDLTDGGTRSLKAAIDSLPAVRLVLANGTTYPFEGKVATVSGVVNTSTGAASVRALFDNPSGMLRSGSTATVVLPIYSTDVIVIPQKATYEIQGRRFVFVVDENNVIASRPITVLPQTDGQNFVVTSGLQAGETIVTEGVGTQSIRDGITIKPAGEQAAPAQAAEAAQAPAEK